MDERPAAQAARTEMEHAFAGEEIQNIGWEEFAFDDVEAEWKIKIGFRWPGVRCRSPNPQFGYCPGPFLRTGARAGRRWLDVTVTDRMLTLVE